MLQKPKDKFNPWSLEYNNYDPKKEKSRETLLAVGNGYLGTRGVLAETTATDTNYPGTYIAGLYNRLISKVADRDIENEDLVNIPNWLFINFKIGNGEWFNIDNTEIISIKRRLNFANGMLETELVVKDKNELETKISSKMVASMANPHLVAIQYKIKPLNYSKSIEIKSEIDGNIINDGVARYRDLNQQHLKPVTEGNDSEISWLLVKTTQSEIEIAQAVKHSVLKNGSVEIDNINSPGKISTNFKADLNGNEELGIEKVVAIYTSKKDDVKEPLNSCKGLAKVAGTFDSIVNESETEWQKIWDKIDIQIEGDPKSQMLIRLHLYHLMVTASPNNVNIDAGIPARGLHGEAYRGHIFWDELYILPLYNLFLPDVAKSVLNYRFR
ncbi:MAG: beta-phosphoglucomutase, partial [Draconibacterium sp.]|nr:beta-phosphoglucomutase [Draconibacterium sp.]